MVALFLHLKDIADRAGPRSVQSGFREEDTRLDFRFRNIFEISQLQRTKPGGGDCLVLSKYCSFELFP